MRTIKFRGKSLSGEWLYGYLCKRGITPPSYFLFVDQAVLPWKDTVGVYVVDPETIGQFTGLTDKNGKEIYEGDIIRSTRNGFGGVVKWHKRGYFYICEDIFEKEPGDYASLGYMLENHPYFEVIGNISDNTPERLKGGEI